LTADYLVLRFRYWNTKGGTVELNEVESTCAAPSKMAASFVAPLVEGRKTKHNCILVVQTEDGLYSDLVSKYRPAFPVCVASPNAQVLRAARAKFAQYPVMIPMNEGPSAVVSKCAKFLGKLGHNLSKGGITAIFLGPDPLSGAPYVRVMKVGLHGMGQSRPSSMMHPAGTTMVEEGVIQCKRSTNTTLELISTPLKVPRCTNIVCTMGPKCWDEETMGKLLDAGMDVIRLNFSHGSHEGHQEVLDRFRKVAAAKGEEKKAAFGLSGAPEWGVLLDTKGPEIRTAMLRDHQPIQLEAGQEILIHAVGDKYTEFEGYKTEDETVIGLSYAKLCTSVTTGNIILLADGTISIEVISLVSPTVLKGRVNNSAKLGERKNGNLPGVKVDLPVLTDKDIHDLTDFACKNQLDYVAASFVQSKEDVKFIRQVLDDAGGEEIRIISKIENAEGLKNFDEILDYTDGIMVARGDLGMEIPAHKVS
jgi:pyruvate kinase